MNFNPPAAAAALPPGYSAGTQSHAPLATPQGVVGQPLPLLQQQQQQQQQLPGSRLVAMPTSALATSRLVQPGLTGLPSSSIASQSSLLGLPSSSLANQTSLLGTPGSSITNQSALPVQTLTGLTATPTGGCGLLPTPTAIPGGANIKLMAAAAATAVTNPGNSAPTLAAQSLLAPPPLGGSNILPPTAAPSITYATQVRAKISDGRFLFWWRQKHRSPPPPHCEVSGDPVDLMPALSGWPCMRDSSPRETAHHFVTIV